MSEENTIRKIEEDIKPDVLGKLPDLKTIREELGLSAEDIFLKTRINASIMFAIENAEFHLLPAPVFSKKLIQIYAEAIGIDAGILLAHYQRYVDEKQAALEPANEVKAQITFDRKPFPRQLLYAIAVVAVIAAGIITVFINEKRSPGTVQQNVTVIEQKAAVPAPPPAVKEQPQEAAPTLVQTPPPAPVVPKETAKTPSSAQLDLRIEATEDTWLNITEDRNPSFQTTLKKGDSLNRTARNVFNIDIGNAAGVNVTFLGKSLGSLGQKGQVVHLRLPQQ
jgi:cytoskeletal protein RodZ